VEKGHGRRVTRRARTSQLLHGYSTFPGLHQVVEVRRETLQLRTGEVRTEVEYAVTSLPPWRADAAALLRLLRRHWSVENQNHHVRDDSWREDRQVRRRGHGAATMSLLLSVALALLRSRSPHWPPDAPLTARAESVRDLTLLPADLLGKVS
jgi:hypothetical protein